MKILAYQFDGSQESFAQLAKNMKGNRIIYIKENDEIIKYSVIKGRAQWLKMIWEWLLYKPKGGSYVISNRTAKKILSRQAARKIQEISDSNKPYVEKIDTGKKYLITIESFSKECLDIVDRQVNEKIDHLKECTKCLGQLEKAVDIVKAAKRFNEITNENELKEAINLFLQLNYIRKGMHPQHQKYLKRIALEKEEQFPAFADQQIGRLQGLIKDYYLNHAVRNIRIVSKEELKQGLLNKLIPEHDRPPPLIADRDLDTQIDFLNRLNDNGYKYYQLMDAIENNQASIHKQIHALSLLEKFPEAVGPHKEEFKEEFKKIENLYQKVRENFKTTQQSLEKFTDEFQDLYLTEEEISKIERFTSYFSFEEMEGSPQLMKLQEDLAKLKQTNALDKRLETFERKVRNAVEVYLDKRLNEKEETLKMEQAQKDKIEKKILEKDKEYEKKLEKLVLCRDPSIKDPNGQTLHQQLSPSILFEKDWNRILRLLQIGLDARNTEKLNSEEEEEFEEFKKDLKRSELDDLKPRKVLEHSYFLKLLKQIQDKLKPHPGIQVDEELKILLNWRAVRRYMEAFDLRPFELASIEQTRTMSPDMRQVHFALQMLRVDLKGTEKILHYTQDRLAKGLEKIFLGFQLEKEIMETQEDRSNLYSMPEGRIQKSEKEIVYLKLLQSTIPKQPIVQAMKHIRFNLDRVVKR